MKTSERVLQFIDKQNITKTEVYNKTGISNGALDKKSNLRGDNLEKILFSYNINPEWLLTGKGEMLKSCEESFLVDLRKIDTFDRPLTPKVAKKLKKEITQYITNSYNIKDGSYIVIGDGATVNHSQSTKYKAYGTANMQEEKYKQELIDTQRERIEELKERIEELKERINEIKRS